MVNTLIISVRIKHIRLFSTNSEQTQCNNEPPVLI